MRRMHIFHLGPSEVKLGDVLYVRSPIAPFAMNSLFRCFQLIQWAPIYCSSNRVHLNTAAEMLAKIRTAQKEAGEDFAFEEQVCA